MPMDSATRNFLGVVGIAATLAAYAVCGFIAYVLIPFLDLHSGALARLGPVCILPSVIPTTFAGYSIGVAILHPWRRMCSSRVRVRSVRELERRPPPHGFPALQARRR